MTRLYSLHSPFSPSVLQEIAALLRRGGLVALPTETVYGLAANARDPQAVSRIFEAKGRPQDNPLIVHIDRWDMIDSVAVHIPDAAKRLANAFWPGPLTMVLPRHPDIPAVVSAGLDTVAVRMPSHPVAMAIISACSLPLAAPSANLSGSPSPTTAEHVQRDLDGRIDAIVDGGACDVGVESTVVSLIPSRPRLLRPGGVTVEQLTAVLGPVDIDEAVTGRMKAGKASAPGMKYKHYAPRARVTLVKGSLEAFCRYVRLQEREGNTLALCFDGEESMIPLPCLTYGRADCPQEQSHRLFAALRELDERGADRVYARCPSAAGMGLAVFNRLQRAAGFDLVTLTDDGEVTP